MPRTFLINAGLLLASIFVSLLLCELGLRLFGINLVPLSLPDWQVGQIERPGAHSVRYIAESDRVVDIKINKQGYRDGKWDFSASTTKVMVVGDSFIEALNMDTSLRMTSLLQEKLQANNPNISVFNFGKSGSGPESYLLVLKKWYETVHPAVVVVAIFDGNDFENVNYSVSPASGRVAYVVQEGQVIPYRDIATGKDSFKWSVRYYLARSYLAQLVNDVVVKLRNKSRPVAMTATSTAPLFCTTGDKNTEDSYLIMKLLMDQIKAIAGDKLVVLEIPERNQEDLAFTDCDKLRPETFFKVWSKETSTPLVQLYDAMLPDSAQYYFDGGHTNEKGNQMMADTLAPVVEDVLHH